MASYGIEFNDNVKFFRRPHCGEESMTVWGWVSKDNVGHAIIKLSNAALLRFHRRRLSQLLLNTIEDLFDFLLP
jgi:hypothetical protein